MKLILIAGAYSPGNSCAPESDHTDVAPFLKTTGRGYIPWPRSTRGSTFPFPPMSSSPGALLIASFRARPQSLRSYYSTTRRRALALKVVIAIAYNSPPLDQRPLPTKGSAHNHHAALGRRW
ncbi:jg20402 [Pararge aegeria aegeria]|uniref:Jg20402 protein n=1 Tax=Pararge aegeria aegeria TaxID=348720 RepID=A0A8S4QUA3_9NEOP|nr:jg20402 [Pararge aegeria aegeria]